MKRTIMCVVALALVMCMLIPANIITADAKDEFFGSATTLAIKNNIEKDADFGKYATAQGSCTDGKYAYFAVDGGSTTLLKYDVNTWELVKKRKGVDLGHANDMTYNAKEDVIIVANNAPDYNIISFVDPDTLKVIKTKKIKFKIYSIAYNEKYDRYVVGISGTYNFAILDSNFKKIKKYEGYESGYLRQGADCDDNYLYFAQSGGGGNLIVIYNWSGELIDTVAVNHSYEIENIFHVKNTVYITLHYAGNFVYRIGISDDTKIRYKVRFDNNGGDGEMNAITVNYGKKKALPKCTFEKENYMFSGWIVRRDSSDKYYGKKTPYSKSEWLKKEDIYEYTLYDNEQEISKTTPVGDVTLLAFWTAKDYRIYYDSNGGEGHMPLRTVKHYELFTLDKSVMTKNGYIFAGWTASREYDGKVYGYKKGKDTPKWLYPSDVYKEYVFSDCQEVSKLTYDLGVTFTAKWCLAFNFSKDSLVLESYIGTDEDVVFPKDHNEVIEIGENAFANNSNMRSVTIPENINVIGDNAFLGCSRLSEIYFEKSLPDNVAKTAFDNTCAKKCYLVTDSEEIFLGYYTNSLSYDNMFHICSLLFR